VATENQAKTDHQEMPEHQPYPPLQFPVTKDPTEIQEAPAHQAHQAHQARMANQAVPVPKVPQAQLDLKEKMANQARKGPKDPKVHPEKKVSVQNIALWTVVFSSKMEHVVKFFKFKSIAPLLKIIFIFHIRQLKIMS